MGARELNTLSDTGYIASIVSTRQLALRVGGDLPPHIVVAGRLPSDWFVRTAPVASLQAALALGPARGWVSVVIVQTFEDHIVLLVLGDRPNVDSVGAFHYQLTPNGVATSLLAFDLNAQGQHTFDAGSFYAGFNEALPHGENSFEIAFGALGDYPHARVETTFTLEVAEGNT